MITGGDLAFAREMWKRLDSIMGDMRHEIASGSCRDDQYRYREQIGRYGAFSDVMDLMEVIEGELRSPETEDNEAV